jgi:hypothetical protein
MVSGPTPLEQEAVTHDELTRETLANAEAAPEAVDHPAIEQETLEHGAPRVEHRVVAHKLAKRPVRRVWHVAEHTAPHAPASGPGHWHPKAPWHPHAKAPLHQAASTSPTQTLGGDS